MASIRMTKTAAGANGPHIEGRVYRAPAEISHEDASGYVSAGAAEWVERPVERAVHSAPETREEPAEDLSGLKKAELVALAEERGVEVERADGKDGSPLASDYVRALSA